MLECWDAEMLGYWDVYPVKPGAPPVNWEKVNRASLRGVLLGLVY